MLDIKFHQKRNKKYCKTLTMKFGGVRYCCVLCRKIFIMYSHYHSHKCKCKYRL